jgi:hypothetical protein
MSRPPKKHTTPARDPSPRDYEELDDLLEQNPIWGPDLEARKTAEQLAAERLDEELEAYGPAHTWEPGRRLHMSAPGRDGFRGVPTVDDDLDMDVHAAPRVYPDHNNSRTRPDTMVVSGPLGDSRHNLPMSHPDLRFATLAEARAAAVERFGAVLEDIALPGRWCFRVSVPGGPADPRGRNLKGSN